MLTTIGLFFVAIGVFLIVTDLMVLRLVRRVEAVGVRCKAKVAKIQAMPAHRRTYYALMVRFTYYDEGLRQKLHFTKRYASKVFMARHRADRWLGREIDIIYSKEHPDFVVNANRRVNVMHHIKSSIFIMILSIISIVLGVFAILG